MLKIFLLFLFFLLQPFISNTQSTCPVIINSNDIEPQLHQQQIQRCKCGIKTDGHIYIYCARKFLKRMPKFMRSSILYDELILSGNLIETISNNSFQGIRVKHLFLDDNRITTIESGAFIELANYLEELVLDINFDDSSSSSSSPQVISRQYSPPQSIFENLLNLKVLKLNGFIHMFKISSYLFNKTRKLEIIHLSNCNLIEIGTNAFSGIELSLRELNLNHNQLNNEDNLSRNLFRFIYNGYFKRLEVINLSYNRIHTLIDINSDSDEIIDDDSSSVESKLNLDLSFNEISFIDERLFNKLKTKLVKLNLNNNELSNDVIGLEDQQPQQHVSSRKSLNFLKNLHNLRELYLDYNHIKHINRNLFKNLVKLEVLSIKGNYIYELSSYEVFNGLSLSLKKLNMASNKLSSLSDNVFKGLGKLKELYLEKNSLNSSLSSTANVFNGLESELKLLNLESNGLHNDNLDSIRNLINIEVLKLGNNNISRLSPVLFRQFVNLSTVDLEYNSFKQVPMIINKTLTSLNLFQNEICYFDINKVLTHYRALKNLNINSNLLECNCHLKSLRVFIEQSSSNSTVDMFMFQNLRCSGPSRYKGKLITSLAVHEFICDDRENSGCIINEDNSKLTVSMASAEASSTTKYSFTKSNTVVQKMTNEYIKIFNVYLLDDNNVALKWQVESDDKVDKDQKFQTKIRYFKLIINELNMPPNKDANITILSSNMKLIHSNVREYQILNSLNDDRMYELCLLMIYDVQEYEKKCQIINTKPSSILLTTPIPASNSLEFYKLTEASNLNTVSSGNSVEFFRFETKQILIGSLIGALIVVILILIIIYLIKINKTSLNEKKLLFEQQQQQKLQNQSSNLNLLPIDYNTLSYGIPNAQNRQILFIRPIATLQNYSKKEKKKSKFTSFFSKFKSNDEDKLPMKQNASVPVQSTNTQPFLLSDLNIFPSFLIKQANNHDNQNVNQNDTTSSSASSTTSTSSAFASFTPILSTTLETLANNSDINSSNYQHMYHEITDTLLSNKSKYLLNGLNGTNATIITNISPFMSMNMSNTNTQQYLISTNHDGYYENHAKEMFI